MRKGFTLVEVLLVIVVLVILAGLVFGLMHFVEGARVQDTEGRVHTIGIEVGIHLKTKGFLPGALEQLAPRPIDNPSWLSGGKFVDSWDRPIQYSTVGEFKVWSLGPDGVSGTADDIRYKNR